MRQNSVQLPIRDILIVFFSLAALFGYMEYKQHQAVKNAIVAKEKQYAEGLLIAVENAQKTERSLREGLQENLDEKQQKITVLEHNLDDALERLRKRPSRSSNSSTTPSATKTCTGAELYREDGQFLRREATRAEKLIQERDFYYEQYERARRALAAHPGSAN